VPFYQLADALVGGWASIQPMLSMSRLSVTLPVDDPRGLRALVPATTREVEDERALYRATSRYLVKADVSQWYPSTYTHSFAWALHGKAAVKAAIAAGRGGRSVGDRLDRFVRHAQSNQTIGIPIGPDTSFALGELILGQCDAALTSGSSRSWVKGFRYYDDYELYVGSTTDADRALTALQAALAEYELTLNPYKFEVTALPQPIEEEWVSALKRIHLRANPSQERTDLTLLFDEAFRLARRYPNDHVLAYALGRFVDRYNKEGHRVARVNWPHVERLLLHASLSEPGVLQKAVHLIYWAQERGWPVNKAVVAESLTALAGLEANRGHSSEVAWALWAAISLDVRIKADAARAISTLDDDVVALTALHARDTGAVTAGLDVTRWTAWMNAGELWGPHWLTAYEAYEHAWLTAPVDYIASDPFAAHLRANDVQFYDIGMTLPKPAIPVPPLPLRPPAPRTTPERLITRVGY
jgi:hypothetical protein